MTPHFGAQMPRLGLVMSVAISSGGLVGVELLLGIIDSLEGGTNAAVLVEVLSAAGFAGLGVEEGSGWDCD
jgi:hypothetical protein